MRIWIFEDETYSNFYPLTYKKAVFELRCGGMNLLQRITHRAGITTVGFFVREELTEVLRERWPTIPVNDIDALVQDDAVIVNSRWIAEENLNVGGDEEAGMKGESIVYLRVKKETLSGLKGTTYHEILEELTSKLPLIEVDFNLADYLWNLVENNRRAIKEDFLDVEMRGIEGKIHDGAIIQGDIKALYIAEGAEIYPHTILNTESGPIIIEKNTLVKPMSIIEGPAFIGPKTHIVAATIRPGTSIGAECNISGEVSQSIIHGYTNKAHYGYIGNSYIGKWVNLGAGTTSSNIKCISTEVTVPVDGVSTPTGLFKVGCFIGDHVKTGIGTLINSGGVIGLMAIVLGGDVLPKYIPPFAVYPGKHYRKEITLDQLIDSARALKEQCGMILSSAEEKLIRKIYASTLVELKKYKKRFL